LVSSAVIASSLAPAWERRGRFSALIGEERFGSVLCI
jgi:hypothetical protein